MLICVASEMKYEWPELALRLVDVSNELDKAVLVDEYEKDIRNFAQPREPRP